MKRIIDVADENMIRNHGGPTKSRQIRVLAEAVESRITEIEKRIARLEGEIIPGADKARRAIK